MTLNAKTPPAASHAPAHNSTRLAGALGAALLTLSACGGGSSPAVDGAVGTPPSTKPVLLANCLDGNQPNGVGADDPFYANAWHLENTGPTQVVSASTNGGVAGMDANVKSVHQGGRGCTGKGVTMAIVDSGLEIAHEDLAANVLPGQSFNFATNSHNPTAAPNGLSTDHGTGVAGVAAAQGWNGKGSRGLAPNASLVGYNAVAGAFKPFGAADVSANAYYLALGASSLADPTIEATALFGKRADTVDVFNMSYGSDFAAPPRVSNTAAEHRALKNGTETLRGGLGAIYLQSAGNEFDTVAQGLLPNGDQLSVDCLKTLTEDQRPGGELAGSVFVNARLVSCAGASHQPDNRPYAYVVAAAHNTGRASSYSSSGSVNWITGFGGEYGTTQAAIISTDDSGCNAGLHNAANIGLFESRFTIVADAFKAVANLFGKSPKDPNCNYTGTMNGTSAAAPSVSGVVALMLEANPKLNWQDVGFILAKTARKIDPDVATGSRAVSFTASGATGPGSALVLDKPWQTNSAGFNFQNRYGFGLVDAAAATRLARDFKPPAGRRALALAATVNPGSTTTQELAGGKYSSTSAVVSFAQPDALSGQMHLEIELGNATSSPVNPGRVQFEMTNQRTGQTSILLPAFTAWYVGGKQFTIAPESVAKFRLHTNAFYGDRLGDGYSVKTIYIRPAGAPAGDGQLDYRATVTSFSM